MQQLRKEPDQAKNVGESWHVDMTCFDEPPSATILFAQECPPYGGDTLWAGMGPAFEGLSEGLRRTLAGLRAVHANVRKLGPSVSGPVVYTRIGTPRTVHSPISNGGQARRTARSARRAARPLKRSSSPALSARLNNHPVRTL